MAQVPIHVGHYGGSATSEQAIGSAVPTSHTWEVKCWITNRTAGPLTFRIRQAFAGAGVGNEQYRAYDTVCPASDLIALPVFTMMASDTLNFTQSANGLTVIADALDVT